MASWVQKEEKPTLRDAIEPVLKKHGYSLDNQSAVAANPKLLAVVAASYEAGMIAIAKSQSYFDIMGHHYQLDRVMGDKANPATATKLARDYLQSVAGLDEQQAMHKTTEFLEDLRTACQRLAEVYRGNPTKRSIP